MKGGQELGRQELKLGDFIAWAKDTYERLVPNWKEGTGLGPSGISDATAARRYVLVFMLLMNLGPTSENHKMELHVNFVADL